MDVQTDAWSNLSSGTNTIKVRYCSGINAQTWDSVLDEVRPDVVHLNSVYSTSFTIQPLRRLRRHPHTKVILAPRGMLGQAALSIKPLKKRMFLALMRGLGWMDGIIWHASSDHEVMEVKRTFPNAQVRVAQNLPSNLAGSGELRAHEHWQVVVVGRIHRVKNVHFGLDAVLHCQSNRPVKIDFIGPVEDLDYELELRTMASAFPHVEVTFHGGKSASELTPHYQSAHYLLSSTTQENFGHSIVEAWAHGCPVLISDRTPWRQLAEKNIGWDWPLEEEVWKEGLTQALSIAPEEWERKSQAARDYFSNHVQSAEAEQANLDLFDL